MPLPAFTASVCVFCGSRPGLRPAYETAAQETGEMLARRGSLGGAHMAISSTGVVAHH